MDYFYANCVIQYASGVELLAIDASPSDPNLSYRISAAAAPEWVSFSSDSPFVDYGRLENSLEVSFYWGADARRCVISLRLENSLMGNDEFHNTFPSTLYLEAWSWM